MIKKKPLILVGLITVAVISLLLITGAVIYFGGFYSFIPSEITRLSRYPEMHQKLVEPLKSLFPNQIPQDRSLARFSWMQPFLQGGGWIQLRLMKVSPENLEREYQKFDKQKIALYHGGDQLSHFSNQKIVKNDFNSANFHTSDNPTFDPEAQKFPVDYSLFILHSEGDWNHGSSHGVAISKQRSEIVYWAEVF